MPTMTKDEFVAGLTKSQVLNKEELADWLKDNPLESPKELAGKLVKDKLLTRWQAKYLLSGRTRLNVASYRLLERIQRDELGDRFLAVHTSLARKVDLQILPSELTKDKTRFKAFIKKASNASNLDHPNLIHVYDIDQEGGRYYLVTEHVEGHTLDKKPKSEINESLAIDVTCKALTGLAYAHQNDVVHGSIKPSDLIISSDNDVKLNHIAVSPLRLESEEVEIPPEADFKSIAKIGVALLKSVPETNRSPDFEQTHELIASLITDPPSDIDTFIESLEGYKVAEDLDDDPLAGIVAETGGFDNPVSTPLVSTVKKKKPKPTPSEDEEDEEEFVPAPNGFVGKLWQENPIAVIATAAVMALMLIGSGLYASGLLTPSNEKVIATVPDGSPRKTGEVDSNENSSETEQRKVRLDNSGGEQPDFSNTDAMNKQIANLFNNGDSGQPKDNTDETKVENKNPQPANVPPKAGAGTPAPNVAAANDEARKKSAVNPAVDARKFKSPLTKEQVAINGQNVPKDTPLEIKFQSEQGWVEVVAKLANNTQQSGWINVNQVYDAGNATDATQPVSAAMPAVEKAAKENPIPEQLSKINGIGDKTQQVFYQAGIVNFTQLGNKTPEEIKEVIANAGLSRFSGINDYQRWIAESRKLAGLGPKPNGGTNTANPTPSGQPKQPAATKPNPAKPFEKFPRVTELPEIENKTEFQIAPLVIGKNQLLTAEMISEPGTAKAKLIFDLTRGDKVSGEKTKEQKQLWHVGVRRREKDEAQHFAVLRKSESGLHFKWLPDAENNKYAQFVRNCSVRLSLPGREDQAICMLRKPIKIRDLRLTAENGLSNSLEFEIPHSPHPETIQVEMLPLRVKDTEIEVISSQIYPKKPAIAYLKRHDKTGFIRLQIAGEVRNGKYKLQSNLISIVGNAVAPITSLDALNQMENQLRQARAFHVSKWEARQNDANLTKLKNQAIDASDKMSQYQGIIKKILNQPIRVRIYSKIGKGQVQLIQTDPSLPQPAAGKKRGR